MAIAILSAVIVAQAALIVYLIARLGLETRRQHRIDLGGAN